MLLDATASKLALKPGCLTFCPLVSSADNYCKQFEPRPGPTKCWAWSGSKQFDTYGIIESF